jgi:hypothetical protein
MSFRPIAVVALLASATLAACNQDGPTISRPVLNEVYTAALAPQAGVTSSPAGSGSVRFEVRDTNNLRIEVRLSGIDSVIAARFLTGGPAGTEVITFYNGPSGGTTCGAAPTATVASCAAFNNAIFRQLDIVRNGTNQALLIAPATFSGLLASLRAGQVYFEVRTRENPTGEIGGALARAN